MFKFGGSSGMFAYAAFRSICFVLFKSTVLLF
jgi:hypothetical protein